jgi:hypothetical protein
VDGYHIHLEPAQASQPFAPNNGYHIIPPAIVAAYAAKGKPATTECLFSYGTLQLASVQFANFGRTIACVADTLAGFRQTLTRIDDPKAVRTSGMTHHPIIHFTGDPADLVRGTRLQITPEELQNADKHEVDAYKRIEVILGSGIRAWVYVKTESATPGS